MKLLHFPEQNGVIAKHQPQYIPMPVHFTNDPEGRLVCCWQLGFFERIHVLFSGKIWHQIKTFHQQLQPQLLTAFKPKDMTWNLNAVVPTVNPQPSTPTPRPAASEPDASISWDVVAPSPTTSDPAAPPNSVESGSFSSALRGSSLSPPPSE